MNLGSEDEWYGWRLRGRHLAAEQLGDQQVDTVAEQGEDKPPDSGCHVGNETRSPIQAVRSGSRADSAAACDACERTAGSSRLITWSS
jgi:hypothetical protein